MAKGLHRLWDGLLVRPEDLKPTRDDFEVAGVFNPGAIAAGDRVYLLLRVAERPKEQRTGLIGLPRWERGELKTDWVPESDVEFIDPRVVRFRQTDVKRLTFASHLRLAASADGRRIDSIDGARIVPEHPWEEYGVEDPRISKVGNTVCGKGDSPIFADHASGTVPAKIRTVSTFFITYVAVSRHGAATALLSTTDFATFRRHGIILPPENKDVLLFPEMIGGKYAAIHRPNPSTKFSSPEMWLARSPDLVSWGSHEPLCFEPAPWESGRVGGGAPPVKTDAGWLVIYHGNCKSTVPGDVGEYAAGALLLDLEQPARILKRSRQPVLCAETEFERRGFVPNVVFPTGIVDRGETFLIYYGAADTYTCAVELSRKELFDSLEEIP